MADTHRDAVYASCRMKRLMRASSLAKFELGCGVIAVCISAERAKARNAFAPPPPPLPQH